MLQGWDPEREQRAKEILYRCLEELGATKAALYLAGSEGGFELGTQYGFGRRDEVAAEIKSGHPLWDWVRRHRTSPSFGNDNADDPDLARVLERAGTARLLTIPLTIGDRLIGFVDARDKGRKLPYGSDDVRLARSIGSALEALVAESGMYGAAGRRTTIPTAPSQAPLVEPSGPRLHRQNVEDLATFVRSLAGLPEVAAAALTLSDGKSVRTLALRTIAFEPHQREALASHQLQRFVDAGVQVPPPSKWGWAEEESAGCEKRADEIRSALVLTGPPMWGVLSVISPPSSTVAEPLLAMARRHVALSESVRSYRAAARNLARTLLEPGETSYPHLRQHSQAVSELAQSIAAALGLPEQEEELITVAAYLHDVGMREIEYQRLYRADRIGDGERRLFQRHPAVGARIVEGAEFPGDLAGAIRHHHERWDGGGYPNKLAGRNIPVASRIIHLAEVYDTLTSTSSYKRPVTRDAALDVIRREAGKQFDPDLVSVLAEVVRA